MGKNGVEIDLTSIKVRPQPRASAQSKSRAQGASGSVLDSNRTKGAYLEQFGAGTDAEGGEDDVTRLAFHPLPGCPLAAWPPDQALRSRHRPPH